jgi:hypothetical protein
VPEETRRVVAVLGVKSQPTPLEKIEQAIRSDFKAAAAGRLLAKLLIPDSTHFAECHRSSATA